MTTASTPRRCALVTTLGRGHSGTLFARLDGALTARSPRIRWCSGRTRWRAGTRSPAWRLGVIVLSLVMAAGCARGLSQRLAEYR